MRPLLLLKLLGTLLALSLGSLRAAEHQQRAPAPHAAVQPVSFLDVAWTDGFWAERVGVCQDVSVPSMGAMMKDGRYKPFLQHFAIAAGLDEGDYHGAQWNDGDFYKWLEAAIATQAAKKNDQLSPDIDLAIRTIAQAQRSDGYLHTPVLIRQRNGDLSAQPFQDRFAFEMYNMGHLMTTACLHYRATGRTDLLDVAERAAQFLIKTFREPTPELARNSVCPSHYLGILDLYGAVGKPEYLKLAQQFFAMRSLVKHGGDDNQDRIALARQREVAGHAVRANYLYCGAADLYAETGDAKLLEALTALWNNMAHKKMYVTGACGALYDGASPDGSAQQDQITRVHQAYGRNYQLPNVTAHNETCANIAGMMWSWRMFLLTGEAKYVDAAERALYNSVLAGVSLAGADYFYVNPLRVAAPLPTELRYPRTRQPFFTSFCCPPNLLRTLAQLSGYAYAKSAHAIWVNLYGSNQLSTQLNGEPLGASQQTDYPWDGKIRLVLETCPTREFSLCFRIPGWARSAAVEVNGKPVEEEALPASYCRLRRVWQPGDVVALEFPMAPVMLESHPLVEETAHQVAIQRGPLVYCLESHDLPPNVRLQNVAIAGQAALRVERAATLLGGVTTIHVAALAIESPPWEDELYRELTDVPQREIDVRLIPYYAWANRGPGEMSVWLPLGRE